MLEFLFKNKVEVVITFIDPNKLVFYPKYLPIPQIGHIIYFEGDHGKVEEVKHITSDNKTVVNIICGAIYK